MSAANGADRTTEMSDIIEITAVEPLDGYWLRLTFSDGAIKDVDVSEIVVRGGVFAAIRDQREVFEQVRVNPDSRTIEWPGEIDLDPEVLYRRYEPASGVRLARREVREPTGAAA
jgi:hypothetical protein